MLECKCHIIKVKVVKKLPFSSKDRMRIIIIIRINFSLF